MIQKFTYPRYPDWPARWAEFIRDCQQLSSDLSIDWEYINCLQFAMMGVEAITGHDPYDQVRQDVSTPLSAIKAIKAQGFNTLDEVPPALFDEIPLAFAQPGDVLLVNAAPWSDNEEILTVIPHTVALADPPFYYAPGLEGLGRGHMYKEALRAFAVGHKPEGGSI